MTFALHAHFGFRPWIAQISGLDAKYGFAQDFIRADERTQSRSGKTGDSTYEITEAGLYRVGGSKHDDGFRLVWAKQGELAWCAIDGARAKAIAKLMDTGDSFDAARKATPRGGSPMSRLSDYGGTMIELDGGYQAVQLVDPNDNAHKLFQYRRVGDGVQRRLLQSNGKPMADGSPWQDLDIAPLVAVRWRYHPILDPLGL